MEGIRPEHIPDIIADRKRFESILYTPLDEAYDELQRRRRDATLERKVLDLMSGIVPEPLQEHPKAVVSRSIMSPNFELRRFSETVEQFGKITPLYWEYHDDKFTSVNDLKRMLGKMYFFHGRGRNNGERNNLLNVINFNESDGKRFSTVRTLWNQGLIDFHHELFDVRYRKLSHTFFDSSDWLRAHGSSAQAYYPSFLALFIRHGILFENVLLNKQELDFASRVFLPTFVSLSHHLGVKPLIVPLEPLDSAENRQWMHYPGIDRQFVAEKMRLIA